MLRNHIKTVFTVVGFGFLLISLLFVAFLSTQSQKQSQDLRSHAQATIATPIPTYPNPIGQTGNWNVIFADDFNNPGLDTTKWTAGWFGTGITGPANSAEVACYDSAQVNEPGDGYVHLNLISQQSTCKGTTRPYTGSLISTNGKFSYTYGYVEFRAYIPPASPGIVANWPALWSDGNNWPTDGENDTMEGLSGKGCYHFHSPLGGPGACAPGDYTGWHTFASDWEPGSVTYYYDGVKVGQITSGITSSPQYLILDNSMGTYGGPAIVPADIKVDYVRVWQLCTTNCIMPTTTTVTATSPAPTITSVVTVSPTPTVAPTVLSPTINPIYDSTSPLVKITYPINQSAVPKNSTITISASASDNVGVKQVEFSVNNTLQCTVMASPYICNYAVGSRIKETYTVTAKAYDAAGNTATSTIQFYSSK